LLPASSNSLPKKTPNGNCHQHQLSQQQQLQQQQLPREDIFREKEALYYSRLDRDRDSIRFEKEEVRSLNHFHLHDKIERIDSFPDSVAGEVT
jgi:hypothetical protein